MIVNIDHTAERGVPNRVLTAQHFIEFCRSITEPCCGDDQAKKRSLSAKELAAYEASIETIRAYIVGEFDFGDTPVRPAVAPVETDERPNQ